MIPSNDCDPAGDLVLKLGPSTKTTLIRVHSKVLSLASPVFAAMMNPRFAEGQALEDNKGRVDSTTTIDLPDDDPEAMSLICRILHFKEEAARRIHYPVLLVRSLAEICEKYDMSRALGPWSHIWMNDDRTTTPQPECLDAQFDRAWVSYALRYHESFWKSTQDIVRHTTLADLNGEYNFLPDNVLSESPVSIIGVASLLLITDSRIQVHSAFTAKISSDNFKLRLKAC